MPLTRPIECRGCPLDTLAKGFSRPEGTGSLGVLFLGEALGDHECADGLPFRPFAPAGSILERILKMCRFSRSQFGLWNSVACQPPKNFLDGAWYEPGAINHCRVHFNRVLEQYKPRVIVPLGNVALRAVTGLAGEKKTISYL